ncbi:Uncharacterised protein [uncultured archaeon]|nr:Uncharacterised protein [uncultured archaeon]
MAMWQKMGMHKYREMRLRFSGQAPIKERISRLSYWKGKIETIQMKRVKELKSEIAAYIARTDDLWSTPPGQKLPLPEKIKTNAPILSTANRWAVEDFLKIKINEDFAITLKKMQKLGLETKTSAPIFYCRESNWYSENDLIGICTIKGIFSEEKFEHLKKIAKKREGIDIKVLASSKTDNMKEIDRIRDEYFWRYTKQMEVVRELVQYEEDHARRDGHFDIGWFEYNQGLTMYRIEYCVLMKKMKLDSLKEEIWNYIESTEGYYSCKWTKPPLPNQTITDLIEKKALSPAETKGLMEYINLKINADFGFFIEKLRSAGLSPTSRLETRYNDGTFWRTERTLKHNRPQMSEAEFEKMTEKYLKKDGVEIDIGGECGDETARAAQSLALEWLWKFDKMLMIASALPRMCATKVKGGHLNDSWLIINFGMQADKIRKWAAKRIGGEVAGMWE